MLQDEIIHVLKETNDGFILLDENNYINYVGGFLKKDMQIAQGLHIADTYLAPLQTIQPNEEVEESIKQQSYIIKVANVTLQQSYFRLLTFNQIISLQEIKLTLATYKQIFDHLNEGVMASNDQGKIFLYNKAQEKLENLKSEDVIGKYLWDVYRINPKTSEHRNVYETKEPIIDQYKAHAYINGVPQYITYNTYPLIKNDVSVGAFSICMNDTRLKDLLHETLELKRELHKTKENPELQSNNGTAYTFESIKGIDPMFTKVIKEAQNIALYNTDILIVGESGTGKELFAQSIHNYSPRAKEPFVAVNCAAIPETLLESTLFGTVTGAYTGAINQSGLFEHAQRGTLFLDEINSMPLSLQAKLIRVLEERKVRRVGSNEMYSIHCNIISASNEDPQHLMKENKLRLDLFYRIAKISLYIPPLRERKEDILFYIDYFITLYKDKFQKNIEGITENLKNIFLQYTWPGNTRELEHLIENLLIRTDRLDLFIDTEHLPTNIKENIVSNITTSYNNHLTPSKGVVEMNAITKELTKENIEKALLETKWNVTHAATMFKMSRQNLQYHIKKHHIQRPIES